MNKFNSEKVMPRYFAIAIIFTVIGFAIMGKAMYIMTIKKDYWTKVASRLKRDSVCVKPTRGNILSCDGQLMASSIPEYRIYMDFKAGGKDKDSLLGVKMALKLKVSLYSISPNTKEDFTGKNSTLDVVLLAH